MPYNKNIQLMANGPQASFIWLVLAFEFDMLALQVLSMLLVFAIFVLKFKVNPDLHIRASGASDGYRAQTELWIPTLVIV